MTQVKLLCSRNDNSNQYLVNMTKGKNGLQFDKFENFELFSQKKMS